MPIRSNSSINTNINISSRRNIASESYRDIERNINPNSSYTFSRKQFGEILSKLTVGDAWGKGDGVLSHKTRYSGVGGYKFKEPSEMAEIQEHALIVIRKSPYPMKDLEDLTKLLRGVESKSKRALEAHIKVISKAATARDALIQARMVDRFEFTKAPTNR